MNLLLVQKSEIGADMTFSVFGKSAEHIFCVLRLQPGDMVKVGVIGFKIGLARVLESSRKTAMLQLIQLDVEPPAPSPVTAIVALPRPQSMKKVIHFIASSGIKRVFFVGTKRVEPSYWESSVMEPATLRREMILGLEQGVDTIPPKIDFYRDLRSFFQNSGIDSWGANTTKFIAHLSNTAKPCPFAVPGPILLAVGPEGGFLDPEVNAFTERGFECVSFGAHVMRVEFALSYLCGRLIPGV